MPTEDINPSPYPSREQIDVLLDSVRKQRAVNDALLEWLHLHSERSLAKISLITALRESLK
jgi:hypothetical protein